MSILFYKRPEYITKEGGPLNRSNCQKYVERAACSRAQTPPELSFENIMEGKTLPPCSLQDFLDYLVYVAHDAENLQFYLWLRDYKKRFNALPASEKRLSPKWVPDEAPPDLSTKKFDPTPDHSPDLSFDKNMTAFLSDEPDTPSSTTPTQSKSERFDVQPFRREISQITAHYILPSAPRELNLSHRDRSALLHALSQTTHPSAFAPVLEVTSLVLRNHSHPNFVRWSMCNGNKPRVLFLRTFAAWWLVFSLILALLLILSDRSRWIRIVVALPLWFSICNMVAARNGLCVLLFRSHTREVHPWEIVAAPRPEHKPSWRDRRKGDTKSARGVPLAINLKPPQDSTYHNLPSHSNTNHHTDSKTHPFDTDIESLSTLSGSTTKARMAPFGPSNTFTHEPWVERWRRTGWVRKLSLRKVWVREEGLRIMQNRIVLMAHGWAILVTVPVMVGVVACPQVGLY